MAVSLLRDHPSNTLAFLLRLAFSSALLVQSAFCANWFVRPNGSTYGTAAGTSWTNAWSGFSGISYASVACGDTIWIAGGTYTQTLVPAKKCTSGSPLYIRRARSDDSAVTTASGWSSGFDATVTHSGSNAEIAMEGDYDYIVISGRTTAAGGSNGWFIDRNGTGSGGGNGISFNANSSDNNTFEYLDMRGPGEITLSNDARGIDCTPPTGSVSGNVFSHLKIYSWESGVYAVGCNSPTFEYIDMYDIAPLNTATFHPNGIITWGSTNGIVRYSKFHKGPNGLGVGEGVFFEQGGGSTGWQIYGNIFYDLDYSGLKAIEISSAVGAIKVYNNTFANVLVGSLYTSDSWSCTGGEWKNNLTYAASNDTCGTASNNVTASSSSAFSNYSGKDFTITSSTGANLPRNAGANLGSPYNLDMLGATRGADGAWDVGAYEYSSAGTAPTITSTSPLPAGTVGTAYSQTLAATGDATITWSVTSGSLPAGLSLSSGGAITGTPTTAGTSTPTITATNSTGNDAKVLSITINAAPSGPTAGVAGKVTVSGKATIK